MTDRKPSFSEPAQQPDSPPATLQAMDEAQQANGGARDEGRRAWRRSRGSGGWLGGAILILVGLVFLLQNLHVLYLHNWWALFILIPALTSFAAARNRYSFTGHFDRGARLAVIWGLAFTALSVAFLLEVQWGLLWPVALILVGVVMLVNALLP